MIYQAFYLTAFIIESLISIFYFEKRFARKSDIKKLVLVTIGYVIISFSLGLIHNLLINVASFLIGNFLILILCYKTKFKSCIFNAILLTALMIATEFLVEFIFFYILSYNYTKIASDETQMLTVGLFSKLLYFIIIYLIARVSSKDDLQNSSDLWLSVLPISTIAFMCAYAYLSSNYEISNDLKIILTIISILILFSNVVVYYIHEQTLKTNKKYTELLLIQQRENNAINYYELLKQQNENSQILIHDIKKHLNSIEMLKGESKTDIQKYLDSVVDDFEVEKSINYCNNTLLNLITYRYSNLCESYGITFDVNIQNAQIDFISEPDITALFDNLLENAIEAAEKSSERFIGFNIDLRNMNFLVISILNSCYKAPELKNNHIDTSKNDKKLHGIGMKSIKRVIKKYDGNLNMSYDEKTKLFSIIATIQIK